MRIQNFGTFDGTVPTHIQEQIANNVYKLNVEREQQKQMTKLRRAHYSRTRRATVKKSEALARVQMGMCNPADLRAIGWKVNGN